MDTARVTIPQDPVRPGEPIDAVYLWVDGADPQLQQALASCRAARGADSAVPRRFRDNGELRYSLRSLEMHAPWIRKVYLVTNGQVPDWLDRSCGRIEVVPHAAIFPDPGDLPTFSSRAIELCLHRIPGLSQRFLCLNDDFFFGRPVAVGDFLDPAGGQKLHFEAHGLPHDAAHPHPLLQSYARTGQQLDRLHGRQPFRPWPAHMPRLFDRRILGEIENLFPELYRATRSHPLRSGDDFVITVFYPFHLLEAPAHRGRHQGIVHGRPSPDYMFFMMRDDFAAVLKGFACIAEWRPRFLCINDDLDDAAPDHPALAALRGLLETMFPVPSRFEKRGDTVARAA